MKGVEAKRRYGMNNFPGKEGGERRREAMKNADRIRGMTDEQMANFLWTWTINSVCSFLEHGGTKMMNAAELGKWLGSDQFVCEQTRVGDDFTYGQDFNPKGSER